MGLRAYAEMFPNLTDLNLVPFDLEGVAEAGQEAVSPGLKIELPSPTGKLA